MLQMDQNANVKIYLKDKDIRNKSASVTENKWAPVAFPFFLELLNAKCQHS